MDKIFLEKIKEQLEARKEEIKKQLEEVADKSAREKDGYEARFPDYGRSEDENADEVATFVDSLSLEENLTNALEAVNLALKSIKEKKYGICAKCSKKIMQKRLEAFPTAHLCLKCKSK